MEVSTLFDLSRHSKKRNYIRRGRANSSDCEIPPDFVTPALSVDMDVDTSASATAPVPPSTTVAEPELKEDAAIQAEVTSTNIPASSDSEPDQLSLTEILRRRKKQARPKKGLDIAEVVPKISRDGNSDATDTQDGVVKDTAEQELAVVVNRFTHQTGHVLNVDKHMYAITPSVSLSLSFFGPGSFSNTFFVQVNTIQLDYNLVMAANLPQGGVYRVRDGKT